ncbi:MAG TPA: hypothetical protein VME66_10140 [Candidatus Acidoferrales bacterium]|nr:hypothetical protein [Candidatus Acidoferrales bacterium]
MASTTSPTRDRAVLATASVAALSAVLVGCSGTPQGARALPSSSSAVQAGSSRDGSALVVRRLDLLKPNVDSGTPGPAARAAFRARFEHLRHNAKAVTLWIANTAFGTLLGVDRSRTKVVDEIDVASEGCLDPVGVRVDHSQNIWVACQSEPSKTIADGSSEQEYSSSGKLLERYEWSAPCPSSASSCGALGANDGGPDNGGHVFASLAAAAILVSGAQQNLDSGFFWWPANKPKSTPTFISLGAYCQPICQPLFMDTDASGNIWFTYRGVTGSQQGFGLGEVTDPTTDPQIVTIFAPGKYELGFGVFTSDAQTKLNVVDAGKRDIYQYELPVTSASAPLKTLGPTASGFDSWGQPITGGFNKAETRLALGDQFGWLNVGATASNIWTGALNVDFLPYVLGASYTPSDR